MSKYHLEKALRRELVVVNQIIDARIIKGLSYSRESKRHKFILSSLARIRRESKSDYGWLARSFSII